MALVIFRHDQGWTQQQFAIRLGVSRRTLVNWENGYWLPPAKQRLHVVMVIAAVSPPDALEIAQRLGVTMDKTLAPALEPVRAAVENAENPPPPRPAPDALRALLDGAVRQEAEKIDIRASALRRAVARVLAVASGATLEDVAFAIAVK